MRKRNTAIVFSTIMAMALTACGATVAETPSEGTMRNDVQTYLTEVVNKNAQISSFEKSDESVDSGSQSYNVSCIAEYTGDGMAYTDEFQLTYEEADGAWVLSKCVINTEYGGRSSQAVNEETAQSGETTDTESSTTADGTVQMSDDISDTTVTLDGVIYQLPFAYSQLKEDGWKCDSSEQENVGGNNYEFLSMTKGEKRMSISVFNPSGNAKMIRDCLVGEISVYSYDDAPEFSIAKDIKVGVSKKEVREAFGEPSQYYEGSDGDYVTLTYGDSLENVYTRITCDKGTDNEYSYASITVHNFTASEEAQQTETSEETPEYLSSYAAPTELGTDPTSGNIEIDGDLYRLPASVSAFLNNGWEITYQENAVPAGGTSSLEFERNGQELSVSIKNLADYQTVPENCAVTGVNLSDGDAPFVLPGGVNNQSSSDEIKEWQTSGFSYSKDGEDESYSYYEYDTRDFSLYLNCENGVLSYMSLDCSTWPQ